MFVQDRVSSRHFVNSGIPKLPDLSPTDLLTVGFQAIQPELIQNVVYNLEEGMGIF